MLNSNAFHSTDRCLLSFLEHHPSLTNALLADCQYDLDAVKRLIDIAIKAPARCQMSDRYIQAIATDRITFLITNLVNKDQSQVLDISSSWLIGRAPTCAISVHDWSVSRCHAVIGYYPSSGFYVTDLGSSNGTWVNRRQLSAHERRILRDGDLIQIGEFQIEFFSAIRRPVMISEFYEATYS